jgi:hypothetical protein
MIWLQLLYVYFKIGIFGFGGGYAMLSLIQNDVVNRYHWISLKEFTDIVAISQMTPGPIGINSATYIGYSAIHNAGYSPEMAILGSTLTTFAVCLPSFILVLLISYYFNRFPEQPLCRCSISRPSSCNRRIDRCCRTLADEQRELHRLEKFRHLRCSLHSHAPFPHSSHSHDLPCRHCRSNFVLVTILLLYLCKTLFRFIK